MTELVKTSGAISTPTPADLLRIAVDKGADLDKLEKLMDLQARWEASQARKAYTEAMTALKSRDLTVRKDKSVSFSGTAYTHSSLAEVVETVVRHMSEVGLSHRWTVAQDGKSITVQCVITHELGHSEAVSMTAPPDESGKKNQIQQIASTITYLQRYTLMSACGLASRDMPDDDGHGARDKTEAEKIAEEWVDSMQSASTLAELSDRRDASAKAYGGTEHVPQSVRKAFSDRKAELSKP
jgi:hypothetical protein